MLWTVTTTSFMKDFPLDDDVTRNYLLNRVAYSLMWGFGGSIALAEREEFSRFVHSLASASGAPLPDGAGGDGKGAAASSSAARGCWPSKWYGASRRSCNCPALTSDPLSTRG